MTPDQIAARNRRNATKSTGPKTAEGKVIVAGNARRHGATSEPDPESIVAWLAIILDKPGLAPEDLLPNDERGLHALALAEAEVRLVAAERALRELENGQARPSAVTQDIIDMADLFKAELQNSKATARELKSGFSLLARISRLKAYETQPGGKRHRLLKRYVREAQTQRRRALRAWLETISNAQRGGTGQHKP